MYFYLPRWWDPGIEGNVRDIKHSKSFLWRWYHSFKDLFELFRTHWFSASCAIVDGRFSAHYYPESLGFLVLLDNLHKVGMRDPFIIWYLLSMDELHCILPTDVFFRGSTGSHPLYERSKLVIFPLLTLEVRRWIFMINELSIFQQFTWFFIVNFQWILRM